LIAKKVKEGIWFRINGGFFRGYGLVIIFILIKNGIKKTP
jgi:hypothetical protein